MSISRSEKEVGLKVGRRVLINKSPGGKLVRKVDDPGPICIYDIYRIYALVRASFVLQFLSRRDELFRLPNYLKCLN